MNGAPDEGATGRASASADRETQADVTTLRTPLIGASPLHDAALQKPTAFRGILFPDVRSLTPDESAQPAYFSDLNLDQVVSALTIGREGYDLARHFYRHPVDSTTISYRQAVFSDLEQPLLYEALSSFSSQMRATRRSLEQVVKLSYYPHAQKASYVDTAQLYVNAISEFAKRLGELCLDSAGLDGLRRYLDDYTSGVTFRQLADDAARVRSELSKITYRLNVRGLRVTVSRYEGEANYSEELLATFDRFKQGAAKDYRVAYRTDMGSNHVQEQVVTLVARLFPGAFGALDQFWAQHQGFLDGTVDRFEQEVQFYLAFVELVQPLRDAGLPFCTPELTSGKLIDVSETFDLPLALKLVGGGETVILNDFSLTGAERILVVSGPNQGGKTTFARMFGQIHHLAAIGCPVPGRQARLLRCDELFTHFEREENLKAMSGKLEEDLRRVQSMLAHATSDSVVVLNEIFNSTTLEDARFLGAEVVEALVDLDAVAVLVTFVEELASLGPATVSMISTVDPHDPTKRTFKIIRHAADGLAYAMAIAEKYGVTYECLKERIVR
jgi:DNA mismatch repair protein MutS